jgi:hypothetical protein
LKQVAFLARSGDIRSPAIRITISSRGAEALRRG